MNIYLENIYLKDSILLLNSISSLYDSITPVQERVSVLMDNVQFLVNRQDNSLVRKMISCSANVCVLNLLSFNIKLLKKITLSSQKNKNLLKTKLLKAAIKVAICLHRLTVFNLNLTDRLRIQCMKFRFCFISKRSSVRMLKNRGSRKILVAGSQGQNIALFKMIFGFLIWRGCTTESIPERKKWSRALYTGATPEGIALLHHKLAEEFLNRLEKASPTTEKITRMLREQRQAAKHSRIFFELTELRQDLRDMRHEPNRALQEKNCVERLMMHIRELETPDPEHSHNVVKTLDNSAMVTFCGGFPGHVVAFGFRKNPDKTYDFLMHNTGFGTSVQSDMLYTEQEVAYGKTTVTLRLNADFIKNEKKVVAFLLDLVRLDVSYKVPENVIDPYTHCYEQLIKTIKVHTGQSIVCDTLKDVTSPLGKSELQHIKTDDDYHSVQSTGNCATVGIYASRFVASRETRRHFKQFKVGVSLDSLTGFHLLSYSMKDWQTSRELRQALLKKRASLETKIRNNAPSAKERTFAPLISRI